MEATGVSNGDARRDKPGDQDERDSIARAMADPMRGMILSSVAEVAFEARNAWQESGRGVTVAALSERTGEALRRVRYHLDQLCDQGLVEVTGERKRRGAVERCFAPTRLPVLAEAEVAVLSSTTQKKIFLGCLRLIFADATASLRSRAAVRRPDWAATRVPGDVDEQGRRELAALHLDCSMRAQEVMTRAQARMEQTKERPVKVVSANLFFEAAPSP